MNAAKRVWRRRAMRKGAEGGLPGGGHLVGSGPAHRVRFGLLGKITVFLVLVLVPLAAVSWTVAYRSLQDNLTRELTDKGSAIGNSLASSGADLIVNRDASTVQAQVDEFAKITGVAYVMVYDPQRGFIAHTFAPVVPKGIVEKNVVPGHAARPQVREITYPDPRTGREREIIDIGVPMLGGQLGTVRVGMDKSIITASAVQAGNFLLLVFGGVPVAAGPAGGGFSGRGNPPRDSPLSAAPRVAPGDECPRAAR